MKLSNTKRAALLVVGLLLATAVGVFVYAEYASSQHVEASHRVYSDARRAIYDQLSADDISVQSLIDVKSSAKQASQELCSGSFVAQWRVSDHEQAECQARQQQLATISDKAVALIERLDTEQAVAEVFESTAKQLTEAKAGDLAAQKKLWSQASQKLADVSEADAYQEYLSAHQLAIKQIVDSYDGLIKAEKTQKRSQFDDAVAELQQAYQDLGEAKADTQPTYRQLANSLIDTVEQL